MNNSTTGLLQCAAVQLAYNNLQQYNWPVVMLHISSLINLQHFNSIHKYLHNNLFRSQCTFIHNLTNHLTGMSIFFTINTISLRTVQHVILYVIPSLSCLTGYLQRFSLVTHNKHVMLTAMVIIMFTARLAQITHSVQNVKHTIQHSRIWKFKHNTQRYIHSNTMTMISFHISESFHSIKPIFMLLISLYCLASPVEPTDCQHSAASLSFSSSLHKTIQKCSGVSATKLWYSSREEGEYWDTLKWCTVWGV